jgi:hypothetical protein
MYQGAFAATEMALLRSFSNRFMVSIHAQTQNKPLHEPWVGVRMPHYADESGIGLPHYPGVATLLASAAAPESNFGNDCRVFSFHIEPLARVSFCA